MSVINRVLKDLDQKGAAPRSLAGVRAVQTNPVKAHPLGPALLIAALAAALWATWWLWPTSKPEAPDLQEVQPRLRLSATLSEPPPPGLPRVQPLVRQSSPVRPEPSVTTATVKVDAAATPIRLDTHLPEPRPAKVIKEVRPLLPSEQAELAWRQSARLIELGRGREALEGLEATLRLDPNHGPARQALIALSLEAGDAARGDTLLREGLRLHPNDAWYNRSLAQLSLQRGEPAQAAVLLKAGLGKAVDADYWGLYAGVLGKVGRSEDAVQAYREAVHRDPEHGPWWVGLAVTLEQADQRAEAAAAYQRALRTRLDPEVREFAAKKTAELGTVAAP